ncbi:SsgA family sporulation/cell division regulator [Streptomyces fructofermentans]|uniref:SsgA family sporulation/cell division regulator n=1 Tax=Streptomyces fructofermentans TaxID=152141 RepID=UPI0016725A80|nr:SsgA family sporulation/cell division regulator [Streptomyces fructofermentans]
MSQKDPLPFSFLLHQATVVVNDEPEISMGMTAHYSAEQPFSVVLALHAPEALVAWDLSREQLIKGLRQHDGWGDVAVWPVARGRGADFVRIRLGDDLSGTAMVEIERPTLKAWLEETCRLVPRGAEPDHLHLDQVIGQLLDAEA